MTKEIKDAVDALRKGKTILYPTDTIWGIGCDALNKKAINKVYEIKRRERSKQMVILASSIGQVSNYVEHIPEVVPDLITTYAKPLTIIYPGAKNLPDEIVGSDRSIAIRVVSNKFCEELIDYLGNPIVSTSANFSGYHTPITYCMIDPAIIKMVDHVVALRQEEVTEVKPSTIIKVGENNRITIIRE